MNSEDEQSSSSKERTLYYIYPSKKNKSDKSSISSRSGVHFDDKVVKIPHFYQIRKKYYHHKTEDDDIGDLSEEDKIESKSLTKKQCHFHMEQDDKDSQTICETMTQTQDEKGVQTDEQEVYVLLGQILNEHNAKNPPQINKGKCLLKTLKQKVKSLFVGSVEKHNPETVSKSPNNFGDDNKLREIFKEIHEAYMQLPKTDNEESDTHSSKSQKTDIKMEKPKKRKRDEIITNLAETKEDTQTEEVVQKIETYDQDEIENVKKDSLRHEDNEEIVSYFHTKRNKDTKRKHSKKQMHDQPAANFTETEESEGGDTYEESELEKDIEDVRLENNMEVDVHSHQKKHKSKKAKSEREQLHDQAILNYTRKKKNTGAGEVTEEDDTYGETEVEEDEHHNDTEDKFKKQHIEKQNYHTADTDDEEEKLRYSKKNVKYKSVSNNNYDSCDTDYCDTDA